jgi:hypothetical protein
MRAAPSYTRGEQQAENVYLDPRCAVNEMGKVGRSVTMREKYSGYASDNGPDWLQDRLCKETGTLMQRDVQTPSV